MATREIEVLFFASLAERVGQKRLRVPLDSAQTVQSLWDMLVKRHASLAAVGFRPLVACDMEYAEWDRGLADVREVAFLPPLSGG